MIAIERIESLPIDRLGALAMEAEATGFRGLSRLLGEWQSGRNRFDRPGETLFIATDHGCVVGVCGLNRDPYLSDPTVGRIRHLYVAVAHRRTGIGSRLVGGIVGAARGHFARLRLRTDNLDADAFYLCLGFLPVTGEPACSHQLVLIGDPDRRPAPRGVVVG
jgi:GNAT superfamily N-acetyltransferase